MSSETETQAPPALFQHCVNVYNAMLGESRSVGSEVESGDNQVIVYEGFLTQLVTGELRLSVPYYTSVRKALMAMGCIRQLRRGGSTTPSQWEMIYEPTVEAFYRQKESKIPKQTREAQLEEMIDSLVNRVNELEEWQTSINLFLIEKFGAEGE